MMALPTERGGDRIAPHRGDVVLGLLIGVDTRSLDSGDATGLFGRNKRLLRFPRAPHAAPDPLVRCWGPDPDPIERPGAIPDTDPAPAAADSE